MIFDNYYYDHALNKTFILLQTFHNIIFAPYIMNANLFFYLNTIAGIKK